MKTKQKKALSGTKTTPLVEARNLINILKLKTKKSKWPKVL